MWNLDLNIYDMAYTILKYDIHTYMHDIEVVGIIWREKEGMGGTVRKKVEDMNRCYDICI